MYFIYTNDILSIIIKPEENILEIEQTNILLATKTIQQPLSKVTVEYFVDTYRNQNTETLVLQYKDTIIKVSTKDSFTVEQLLQIKEARVI